MNDINWIEMLFTILLSSFGGIVHRLADQEKTPGEKVKISAYMASGVMSMFVGIFAYFLCRELAWSLNRTVVVTMIAGFLGVSFINWVINIAIKKHGLPELNGGGSK